MKTFLSASCRISLWCSLGGSFVLAQAQYRAIEVRDGGTIFGVVRLLGDANAVERMEISKDEKICGTSIPSPRLRLGTTNGLQDAVIRLDGITTGKAFAPVGKATLDQEKCEYVPLLLLVPVGTQLEIVNSDPILHNVHTYDVTDRPRTVFNIAQPIKGQRTAIKQTQMNKPGLFLATCDAGHPWMSAYIVVADHPYYASTDKEGTFMIENIPPGSYTITMWHAGIAVTHKEFEGNKVKKYHFEEPYEMTKAVVVQAGTKVQVDFGLTLR